MTDRPEKPKEAVRRIIDAEWLDEDSKQRLRESWGVTDEDMAAPDEEAS